MPFEPREAQRQVLAYAGGELAIAAVPGAGKTTSLVLLATKLIVQDGVRPGQVLILTYTRSAAANIRERIRKALLAQGVSAHGLKAQTIHGFCHELLSRRAGRLGFPEGLQVLSEGEADPLLQSGLRAFLATPAQAEAFYASHGLGPASRTPEAVEKAERISRDAAKKALSAFKNLALPLDETCAALEAAGFPELPAMLRHYEMERQGRGLVDYDDMIRLTNELLAADAGLLAGLQRRFRYVLEDEAQDSTPGQKRIIDQLVAPHRNLIRVGDSNQSIYATFTLNSPEFFRAFCQGAPRVDMAESSRSRSAIIALANGLVEMATATHPQAFEPTMIVPARDGSNPPPHPKAIEWTVYDKKGLEVERIAQKIAEGYGRRLDGRHLTHAILVPTNPQATDFIRALEALGVPVADGGAAGTAVQMVAEVVLRMLRFLVLEPDRHRYRHDLMEAFLARLRHREGLHPEDARLKLVRSRLTAFITDPGPNWRALLATDGRVALTTPLNLPPGVEEDWRDFLATAGTLLALRHISPVDLVTAIAGRCFDQPYQLSVAHAIALQVRRTLYLNPAYRLREVVQELTEAWQSNEFRERLFPATLEELSRDAHTAAEGETPRPVRILTLHSAKGLEFDVVWMPALHNSQHFPWTPEQARINDERVLEVDVLIEAVAKGERPDREAVTRQARQAQVEERLRLLYVGITRAQRFLRLSFCRSDYYAAKHPHLVVAPHIERLKAISR